LSPVPVSTVLTIYVDEAECIVALVNSTVCTGGYRSDGRSTRPHRHGERSHVGSYRQIPGKPVRRPNGPCLAHVQLESWDSRQWTIQRGLQYVD